MTLYTFSATQWIYGNEPLEASCARLRKYGYDGVELAGEPYTTDLDAAGRVLRDYGLACTSICGIYTKERDLSSTDPEIGRKAVQYVKDCVDMAAALSASHVIVVPSPVGKLQPAATREEEWSRAVANVAEAGRYALSRGIRLAVEALNRYETYLINDLETASRFIRKVNVESVKLMADLFHMNIEERNIPQALQNIAEHLIHVHIADNTREAAGWGQTDFKRVMDTLAKIDYRGPITMEFLPRTDNPYRAAHDVGDTELHNLFTEQSIRHIKQICQELNGK